MQIIRFVKWLCAENWQYKAKMLCLGLIAFQYLEWFAEYWLDETYWITGWSLFAIFVLELFARMHRVARRILQFAAIVFINLGILHFRAAPLPEWISWKQSTPELFHWLIRFLTDLYLHVTPFIWFALAGGVIYIGAIRWMTGRLRILLLTIGTVLLFSGIDSFSRIEFFDQVGLVIFSGLILLLIDHFSKFKQHHPHSWQYVAEYPGMLISLIVALAVVIVLAAWVAPNLRPLLTDPYTMWKHAQGEVVDLPGKPFDNPKPKETYTSGYSRNDEVLGGQFSFDYTPIMSVDTDYRSYWKGETREIYTGQGWRKQDDPRAAEWTAVNMDQLLPQEEPSANSKLATREITQTFTILKKENYPVLFGAYSLEKLVELKGGTPQAEEVNVIQDQADQEAKPAAYFTNAAWSAKNNELAWNGETYPAEYTVVSQIPIIDEAGLRTAPQQIANVAQFKADLQLPAELPDRVKVLAADLTKNEPTAYDKVKRIETYLQKTYPYTNEPDLSLKKSDDFVDSFLFEIKQGYCDYFSTAMTVMVRSLGIPARWVKGYTSGSRKDVDELYRTSSREDIDGPGEYVVRNADAHSWVEVYFQGWGWIPFEPTSGFVLPVVQAEQQSEAVTLYPDQETAVPTQAADARSWRKAISYASVAVIALLLGWILVRWRRLSVTFRWRFNRRNRETHLNQMAVLEFGRMIKYAKSKGYTRKPGETMRETAARWGAENERIRTDMAESLSVFELARYSGEEIQEQDMENLHRTLKNLREAM